MIFMNLDLTPRRCFLAGFLFCLGLLVTALIFQFSGGLEPCPLCISQRIMVLVVGLILLVAVLHNPRRVASIRGYALAGSIAALAGAGVSARHVWLQHLPADQVPACGPGLSYMLQYFAFSDTLKALLSGTGDCAKVDWTLLGLSMPVWVLFCFLGLAVLSGLQWWNVTRNS
jgi:disulfide bond formation protein DsbB